MIEGNCHCGACGYRFDAVPPWATSCNCSICRKLGVLWIYAKITQITVFGPTISYSWGDKALAFHSCSTCGTTTHWENLRPQTDAARMAVNLRLAAPKVIGSVQVRNFDGADTWKFLD
jgi:hypothetical protein